MGFIVIILVVILVIVLAKVLKKPSNKKQVKETGEEIYKISKIFLSKIKKENLSDDELQKIMTFVEGFSRYTDKENKYRDLFIKDLGYGIMAQNPHIFVRIKDGELDCFIYSNNGYAISLNKETKDLEISKIK